MKVLDVVDRLGGVADARVLVRLSSRRKVRTALGRGVIVRDARGRYALPTADEGRRAAHRLSGVMTGKSAAAHYGWEMKTQPVMPTVTVPRNRKVTPERRRGVQVRWRDIPPEDELHGVLRKAATVIDCARTLPFDESLAIADSALRHGHVTRAQLLVLARAVPTTGRDRALGVARHADGRAANPFESVLRAIALGVAGLDLEPQRVISERGFVGRPDLVDVERRLVVEAESFEFHGRRNALAKDCRRYTALVLRGWRVVRFSWEDVMLHPDYVRACLEELAALPAPAVVRRPRRRAAPPGSDRISA